MFPSALGSEVRLYDVDRALAARADDPRDRLALFSIALDAGALIVDTTGRTIDPSDGSGMGELDYYLRTFFAAQERRKIVRRTQDGRRRKAAAGVWTGTMPWWVKRDGDAYHVIEDRAEVLRRAVALVLDGESLRAVADALNAAGGPKPRGGRWRESTLRRMLHAPALHGEIHGKLGGAGFTIPVPAIIDRATWDRVNGALRDRRNRPRREYSPIEALLRDVAVCGECGRGMHVDRAHGQYTYYRCATRDRRFHAASCANGSHAVGEVDAAVWREVALVLSDPRVLEAAVRGEAADAADDWAAQVKGCKATLDKLRRAELFLLREHGHGLIDDETCRARLRELKADRDTAERSLALAERAAAKRDRAVDAAADLRDRLAGLALDGAGFGERRAIVRALLPAAPYRARLNADGTVELVGVLDAADLGATGSGGGGGVGEVRHPSRCAARDGAGAGGRCTSRRGTAAAPVARAAILDGRHYRRR